VPTVGMLIGSYVVMGLEKRNKRNRGRWRWNIYLD
jgi:hypothetical protein